MERLAASTDVAARQAQAVDLWLIEQACGYMCTEVVAAHLRGEGVDGPCQANQNHATHQAGTCTIAAEHSVHRAGWLAMPSFRGVCTIMGHEPAHCAGRFDCIVKL